MVYRACSGKPTKESHSHVSFTARQRILHRRACQYVSDRRQGVHKKVVHSGLFLSFTREAAHRPLLRRLPRLFRSQLKLCTPCKPFKVPGKLTQPLPTSFRKSHNGMRRYTALETGLPAFLGLLWAFCLFMVVVAVIAACSQFYQCNGEPSGQHRRHLRQGQAACGENAYHKPIHDYAYPLGGCLPSGLFARCRSPS